MNWARFYKKSARHYRKVARDWATKGNAENAARAAMLANAARLNAIEAARGPDAMSNPIFCTHDETCACWPCRAARSEFRANFRAELKEQDAKPDADIGSDLARQQRFERETTALVRRHEAGEEDAGDGAAMPDFAAQYRERLERRAALNLKTKAGR